jgi:hypothetical protein
MPKAVTANRLTDGIVVFYDPAFHWVESLQAAALFATKQECAAALERAKADIDRNLIIDPFEFDVIVENGVIRAAHMRDAIRANGPTIHRDHGKQAREAKRANSDNERQNFDVSL